ncbi:MAG TPA: glycogen debranching protein GlgX [Gemmataceae bacterium]|nr:glycogen debranching protein GlgX [Gemmataceae bacterium]
MLRDVAPVLEPSLLKVGAAVAAPPRPTFTASRGQCRPFGPTPGPDGVNFAVFSRHAEAVSLVLFRDGHDEPLAEIALDPALNKTGDVWHVFVHGFTPDLQYGYRVRGPFNPKAGHRFHPQAVLLDPYAPAVAGGARWGDGRRPRRSRLVVEDFDWEGDAPPATPLSHTVIYELHVRGFTQHPSSAASHPGTFLGLCERIAYLKSLGVTAVQLMPILEFDEQDCHQRNPSGELLPNYWGYAPLSFFAPKAAYAAHVGRQVQEFKQMVKAFHKAGIEVILDVVYNHTGEGGDNGPAISFRGLDNAIYYMLDREGRYYNFSGCGNTLNCNHPLVRDLIIDSLAHLVSEFHVDGFRFDLAAALGRGPDGKVLDDPPLLKHIAEHPVLAGTKLLAEAWDGAGLSQLGKFPAWGRWAEFNGWFRDDVRRFIRGDMGAVASVAKRICGSLDLYGDASRHPHHSINYITCHDGFTLWDLVSYTHKHNLANGEHNRDGWDDNLSSNCGHEGPTQDGWINAVRHRQVRNFLTLLLISQGVPLLTQGDEFGRTQHGNNNAYCQDNEISWVDWSLAQKNAGLVRFTRMMIALRARHFAGSRDRFVQRVSWHGAQPNEPDWTGQRRALAFQLHGRNGQPDLYVVFNAWPESQKFTLPHGRAWKRLVDTNLPSPEDVVEEKDAVPLRPGDHYLASGRSAVILTA